MEQALYIYIYIGLYMNYKHIDYFNTSIAKCLCVRDFKGFGSGFDTQNGVLICKIEL